MKIRVKIKFGSTKDSVENFGNSRYLIYMKPGKEDPDAMSYFIELISKYLGANPKDAKYIKKSGYEEYIFEI